jgi:putative DNA primase/helicase
VESDADLDLIADDSPRPPKPKGPLFVAPEAPPDRRVVLVVETTDPFTTSVRAVQILATHPDAQRVYRRATGLTLVDQVRGEPATMTTMTRPLLGNELSRCSVAKSKKRGDDKLSPVKFPSEVLDQVLGARVPGTDAIRPLIGIATTPFFSATGDVVTAIGYHAPSGYLVADSALPVRVREKPTREHAAAALAALRDVFVDFPYPIEADRYVPIAALLTILATPGISGSLPGFLFDATTAGSGKTLQQDVLAGIATGSIGRKAAWIRDEDERRKSLYAAALSGDPILAFDNVSRDVPFGGDLIDALLTSGGSMRIRPLGSPTEVTINWRPVVLVSGNNIGLTGDTNRRVLRARLQTDEEDPEKRTAYVHPERADCLVSWAIANRAKLVAAGLTILRAFHVAGRPNPLKLGSFSEWAALVPSAIVFAGGPNVIECVPAGDDISTDTDSDLRAFIASWRHMARHMSARWTARDLVATVWREHRENDDFTEFRDAAADAMRTKPGYEPSSKAMGKLLSRWRGRVVAGQRVMSHRDPATDTHVWSVETVTKGEKK